MIRTVYLLAALAAGTTVSAAAAAAQTRGDGASYSSVVVAQASNAMADGEVRKVDKDAKKITLKHGEIKNLGMPPMTMVFQVKDPAMLDQVKQGDKVRFQAEQVGGATVVTHIEPVK